MQEESENNFSYGVKAQPRRKFLLFGVGENPKTRLQSLILTIPTLITCLLHLTCFH